MQSLPRMQGSFIQRSDGEEEEDSSINLSSNSSTNCDLPDWEGLTLPLPITFQQGTEGDHPPFSLGDFVRHMHPYCMTICVENEQGEHMLPEGGILLEVVDKGENGEPILAIPNIELPISVPLKEASSEKEQRVSVEAEEDLTDSSEHIVVDDEDDVRPCKEGPLDFICPVPRVSNMKDEIASKKEVKTKNPTRRKKKPDKNPKPAEGRVLRSGTVCKTTRESLKKAKKLSAKEEKNPKISEVPPSVASEVPKEIKPSQTETKGKTTAIEVSECNVAPLSPEQEEVLNSAAEKKQSSATPAAVNIPEQPVTAAVETEGSTVPPSGVSSENPIPASNTEPASITAPVPEPKPKSLSLEEYRRLRQQRKPTPVEVQDNNSTKWPSLPEPPKELPPIPCLLQSNPKDPRRPGPQAVKKDVEEVRPAWQPRGPGAPPTPEALLVPPAYMMSSTSKVAASTPKAQKTQDVLPQMPSPPAPSSVKNLTQTPVQPEVPSVPQSAAPPASVEVISQIKFSKDGTHSPIPSQRSDSVEPTPKITQTHPTTINETMQVASKNPSKKPLEITALTSSDGKSTRLPATSPQTSSGLSKPQGVAPGIQQHKDKRTTAILQKANKSTQELIEAFTSEIGKLLVYCKNDFYFFWRL